MGACIWLLLCTSAGCEHSGDQGEAGRGACLYVETHQKLLSGPAESEGTGNHNQQDGGHLHILQGACSLSCTSFKAHTWGARFRSADSELLGLHVFRDTSTLFLRQNRLELSKGVFTGDGSGFGLIINRAEV